VKRYKLTTAVLALTETTHQPFRDQRGMIDRFTHGDDVGVRRELDKRAW